MDIRLSRLVKAVGFCGECILFSLLLPQLTTIGFITT